MVLILVVFLFFFFKQKTAYEMRISDWSSDVCSSDLHALPALLRAEKLQKRAARTGFDWPDSEGVYAKIDEEIEEGKDASSEAHREEEIGDLLFAVVNLARNLKVDSDQALRLATAQLDRKRVV